MVQRVSFHSNLFWLRSRCRGHPAISPVPSKSSGLSAHYRQSLAILHDNGGGKNSLLAARRQDQCAQPLSKGSTLRRAHLSSGRGSAHGNDQGRGRSVMRDEIPCGGPASFRLTWRSPRKCTSRKECRCASESMHLTCSTVSTWQIHRLLWIPLQVGKSRLWLQMRFNDSCNSPFGSVLGRLRVTCALRPPAHESTRPLRPSNVRLRFLKFRSTHTR